MPLKAEESDNYGSPYIFERGLASDTYHSESCSLFAC